MAKAKKRTAKVWLLLGTDMSVLEQPFWHKESVDDRRAEYGNSGSDLTVVPATLTWSECYRSAKR